MKLSAFIRCGHLRLSSKPPLSQRIYEAMMAAWGGDENFDQTFDAPHASRMFADAMGLATLLRTLERGGNQGNPDLVLEFVAEMERDYGVIPDATEDMQERRAALVAARRLPAGARRENVERCMRDLLGAEFVAYRTCQPAEIEAYPAAPETGPGNWRAAEHPIKLWRTTTPVSITGVPVTIGVQFMGGSVDALLPNETATLDAGKHGQSERITIAAATTSTITTTCTRAHDSAAWLTTGSHPYWFSSQRIEIIVVTEAIIQDAPLRKRLNELCHKLFRGVSRWILTVETSPGWIGPFRIGAGRIGFTPLGELSV